MVLKLKKRRKKLADKKKSPTLLTTMAFIADLLASTHVNQKLINKKEQTPIASQPKNNCIKFSLVTRTIMENVNNVK